MGNFEVVAFNTDGKEIQRREITDAGTFTIEDIQANALARGLDELKIIPKGFETHRDGNTEILVEEK